MARSSGPMRNLHQNLYHLQQDIRGCGVIGDLNELAENVTLQEIPRMQGVNHFDL
jgi:hypothetical protein